MPRMFVSKAESDSWIASFQELVTTKTVEHKWSDIMHRLVMLHPNNPQHNCISEGHWEIDCIQFQDTQYNNKVFGILRDAGIIHHIRKELVRDLNRPDDKRQAVDPTWTKWGMWLVANLETKTLNKHFTP